MKRCLFVLLLVVTVLNLRGQTSNGFYKPNGEAVTGDFSTIKSMLTYLGSKNSDIEIFNNNESVYFKKLSNIPVLILLENGVSFRSKEYYVNKYNYKKYLNSYSFYYDLQDMIKEGQLTNDYLIEVFGQPTRIEKLDGQNVLTFARNNCKVYSDLNGEIFFADVHNYSLCSQLGLSIESFNAKGSDYSIGFDVVLENYSKKTIKYVTFTVKALNDVNDIVSTKTVKGVGPIKFGGIASYEFDDLILSRSASQIEIIGIKLQYMDGTVNTIARTQIKDIIKTDWVKEGKRIID